MRSVLRTFASEFPIKASFCGRVRLTRASWLQDLQHPVVNCKILCTDNFYSNALYGAQKLAGEFLHLFTANKSKNIYNKDHEFLNLLIIAIPEYLHTAENSTA